MCDYNDVYIVVTGKNTVTAPDDSAYDKKLAFENDNNKKNAPFISWISKLTNTLIDSAEDLDIVILTYNLLEYSKNYRRTNRSLWNYYRDESNRDTEGNINYSIKDSKSFNYKTSIKGKLEGNM